MDLYIRAKAIKFLEENIGVNLHDLGLGMILFLDTMFLYVAWKAQATKRKTDNKKCWQGHGETATLIHCWWDCKIVQQLWKTVWQFLKRNKKLPYNLATLLLSIHPREMKTCPHKILYMNVRSSIIYNSQKVGTIQISISWWMDK